MSGPNKLVSVLLLVIAVAPSASAQSSIFGARGLGHLGRGLSVAALGTEGANGLFDVESSRNPATMGLLRSATTSISSIQGWRSSETPAGRGSTREQRFPSVLIGGPIPKTSIGAALSYTNYANRDFLLVNQGVESPRGVPVVVTDSSGSLGGLSDMRLAVGWSASDKLQLGVAAHMITGSNELFSTRAWEDTSYLPIKQKSELSYLGFGVSVGMLLHPTSRLWLGGSLRKDGSLSIDRDSSSTDESIALPISISAGARYLASRRVAVVGQITSQNWGSSNRDLIAQGGVGSENTLEFSAGVELAHDSRRPDHLPLKVGFRKAQLPFLIAPGQQPSELGFSVGTGIRFAQDLGGLDFALERVSRESGDNFSETAWQLSIGVVLRGAIPIE